MGCGPSSANVKSDTPTAVKYPTATKDFVAEDDNSSFKSQYDVIKQLGSGGYSIVKLVQNRKTGVKAAVKCINRKVLNTQENERLREEVAIMMSCTHPNIVKLFDFYEEEHCFYLTMEVLEGGELFDRISQKTIYTEKEARDVIYLLLMTINYCHKKGIVHRDLKPENILLKSKDNDTDIKIIDFGFAANLSTKDVLQTRCGSQGYQAPEILKSQPYGCEVDLWSIGVIMYILIGGYPPFHHENAIKSMNMCKKGEFKFHSQWWSDVSHDAKDLISRLLTVNPKERFTTEQALKHDWILSSPDHLSSRSLDSNLEQLKGYVANRRFKAAAHAVRAMVRLSGSYDTSEIFSGQPSNESVQTETEQQEEKNENENEKENKRENEFVTYEKGILLEVETVRENDQREKGVELVHELNKGSVVKNEKNSDVSNMTNEMNMVMGQ
eukprot:CAMPEP_0182418914 /NCGR_PEP_ID=MMETSP1167-20130531/3296_1 /TAXON_ID=2988 /ORGANISM="Mallomonas Sp, Strain CCMP3275" /LENGTH=439 /DNA_ID=CAMNT_0024593401 /DNA_START=82 /DNA_END=1401 /DNA_ORIENTATION=+